MNKELIDRSGAGAKIKRLEGGARLQGSTGNALSLASAPGEFERENDARRLLDILSRWKWMIVIIIALGAIASVIQSLYSTPLYRAAASLEVHQQSAKIIEGSSIEPETFADYEFMTTQHELLRSRSLAERVADVLKLQTHPRFATGGDPRERLALAADYIQASLQVQPVRNSRVVTVRFISESPTEAADVANAIVDNFIEVGLQRRYDATTHARAFLDQKLELAKAALEGAERKLADYSREREIIDLSGVGGAESGGSLDASSLVALNGYLATAEQARVSAELALKAAMSSPASLDGPAVQTLSASRAELIAAYQEKLSVFKPDYPAMKEIQARIDALDGEIGVERKNVLDGLERNYRVAAGGEAALKAKIESLKSVVQDLRSRSIDYNILAREVETQRVQYEALLQRQKELSATGGAGASQVSIVDRADEPKTPFEPSFKVALIRGLFLSFFAAVGLAFLLDFLGDAIKTPEDVRAKLGLPVIGAIPRVSNSAAFKRQVMDPGSAISTAFSSARNAVQYAVGGGASFAVLVTGVRPGEGKSSACLALAIAFSGIGKRALIIDADLRRPSFASGTTDSRGLAGLLAGEGSLASEIVPSASERLFLLPAGLLPSNPAELVSTPRIEDLLDEARRQFDVVIVDSPPVLEFADAPALAAVCDATLLAVSSRAIRAPAARRALERLLESGAHVAGVLLTKFRSEAGSSYSYASTYGRAYQYKSGQGNKGRGRVNYFATTGSSEPRA